MTFNVMMMLGAYPFMLNTAAYETLRRTASYRWEEQGRIGRRPAQQFIGPGAGQISLDGAILPHWKGGYHQLDAMRAQAGLGKPLMLVDGRGYICGDWVITKIDETGSEFWPDGAPRTIRFALDLTEYGDDAGSGGLGLAVAALSTVARLI